MRLSRFFLWAMAVTIVLTIAMPIASVLFYSRLLLPFEIFVVLGMMLLLYWIVALGCAVALENGRAPRLMRSGIVVGAVSICGWIGFPVLGMVGQGSGGWFSWHKVLTWPTSWAGLMMLIGLVLLPTPPKRWWIYLRRTAIVLLALLAAHICLATTFYPADWHSRRAYEEVVMRLGAILALLAVGALAATLLSAWLLRLSGFVQQEIKQMPYWFQCPRCLDEQSVATGTSNCRRCGLRVRVELS